MVNEMCCLNTSTCLSTLEKIIFFILGNVCLSVCLALEVCIWHTDFHILLYTGNVMEVMKYFTHSAVHCNFLLIFSLMLLSYCK